MRLHWGTAVALVAAVGMWLFLFRTFTGIQLQVGGPAPAAARYAGFSSRAAIWTTLLISGGLSGVAGAFEVTGPMGQLTPHVSAGYGFTAIIVAWLGKLNPLLVVLSSFFFAGILVGGDAIQISMQLPAATVDVFNGVLLVFMIAGDYFLEHRLVLKLRRAAAGCGES
jgi:simple sugar transport system permease protein